jgi:hypothetical protein
LLDPIVDVTPLTSVNAKPASVQITLANGESYGTILEKTEVMSAEVRDSKEFSHGKQEGSKVTIDKS